MLVGQEWDRLGRVVGRRLSLSPNRGCGGVWICERVHRGRLVLVGVGRFR